MRKSQVKTKRNKQRKQMMKTARVPRPVNVVRETDLVRLKYVDSNTSRFATANDWSVFTMKSNDPWDPDPLAASGAVSFFAQYAVMYEKYRVTSVRVRWSVTNLSTSDPIVIFMQPQGIYNVVPGSSAEARNFAEQRLSTPPIIVGPKLSGSGTRTIVRNFDLPKVYGNPTEFWANETLTGRGTAGPTSPTTIMYLQFLAYGPGALTGIFSDLRIEYTIKFYQRAIDLA